MNTKKRRSFNHTRRRERKRKTKNKRKMVGGEQAEELIRQLEQLTEDELSEFKLTDEQLILLRIILQTKYGKASFLKMLSIKPVFLGIHSQVLSKKSGHHLIVDILTSAIDHSNVSYLGNDEVVVSLRQKIKREWLNIILAYMKDNRRTDGVGTVRNIKSSCLHDAEAIIKAARINDEYEYDDYGVYEKILHTIEKQYDKL